MGTANLPAAGTPASFTDPDYFDLEKERIFKKNWICAGHVSQLARPGDYLTLDLFGAPIVVVRGQDDQIRALSNVCLHRAMPIAEGSGNTHVLTCPYHLWAYDLDGQLKSTPLIKKDSGIDLSQYKLPCLKTEVWEGLVFVTHDKDAAPLAPQITELTELLAPHNLADLVEVGNLDFPSPFNWKVLIENFMEAYHHIGPHKDTLQPFMPAIKSSRLDQTGPFSVLDMPPVDDDHDRLWAMCLYPNMLFAVQPTDPPFLTWYQMSNMSHDHFDLTVHIYLDREGAKNKQAVEGALALTQAIHMEDIPMCEGVQTGIHSPFAIHGPLAPTLEDPLAHFRAWIDDQLAE